MVQEAFYLEDMMGEEEWAGLEAEERSAKFSAMILATTGQKLDIEGVVRKAYDRYVTQQRCDNEHVFLLSLGGGPPAALY